MTGKLYIDGIDVYARYGVYVLEGGYNSLIAYAPLKSVYSNNWQEWDGLDVDLTAPRLDTKSFDIRFAINKEWNDLGAFIRLLSEGAYHDYNFAAIGRTYRLRMLAHSSLDLAEQLGLFSLQFADDFPMGCEDLESYNEDAQPIRSIAESDDYILGGENGERLTNWNVRVLDGTFIDILKSPIVKGNMLRTIGITDGVEYDPKKVRFKEKAVRIKCLMRADSLEELWQNWDSLRARLIKGDLTGELRNGLNSLYVATTGEEYEFYYKGCEVSMFKTTDKIWLEFSLNVVFTKYRLVNRVVLVSESGELINAERFSLAIDLGTIDGND